MAKNFNLSLYQITINKRRDKKNYEVLSDFMNGTDLLKIVNSLLRTWKYVPTENTEQSTSQIQKDDENERVFRIMNIDSKDQLFANGRYITGIIESGDYGTEENIVDVLTGKPSHTKKITESILYPFYFMFYLPENSKLGFLIVGRIGNLGIYSLIESKLRLYTAPKIDDNCVLKVRPLVLKKLVNDHLKYVTGGAKKIIFEKVRKEDLHVSKLSNGQVSDENVDNIEVVYNAKRNHLFNISQWFNVMNKNDKSSFYIVEDIEYEDVKFEFKVQGTPRKVSIKEIEKLGTYMDVTEFVTLANNKYPTYESINKQAHLLITHIKEQFNHEKE